MLVVPILRVRVTNRDVGQPLYLSASNPAGNDHSAGEPMVWVQELAVLLVGDQHLLGWIHGVRNRNLSTIRVIVSLGKLALGASEMHKPAGNAS